MIEGIEGGGFKNPNGASTMVLGAADRCGVDVPIVSAGGISDGISMAAAFTLGAEGVQMGTRMLTAAESPVHENWKQAVLAAAETDTVIVNRYAKPAMRTLRTDLSSGAERADVAPPLALEGSDEAVLRRRDERRLRDERAGRRTDHRGAAGPRDPRDTWRDCRAPPAPARRLLGDGLMSGRAPLARGSVSLRVYPHLDLPAAEIVAEMQAQAALGGPQHGSTE